MSAESKCPFAGGAAPVPVETMPDRIKRLPVHRGFPVPWFVAKIDGEFDFRVADQAKYRQAVRFGKCWVCGEGLGANKAFVIGPMCGINRTSAEPPVHLECARYSVLHCPFLTRPHMKRREGGIPEEMLKNTAGFGLKRNPGASGIWVTKSFKVFPDHQGRPLIEIGPPEFVEWYAEGRFATRAEVEQSIDSGIPSLEKMCEMENTPERVELAKAELRRLRENLNALLPDA